MRKTVSIILILVCWTSLHAQEGLQKALDRYDYGSAVHMIDSLMAMDGADSVSLALQKARCLRKLYRAEEAAGALAEVLHIDQYNIELMAELAECHTQAGNSGDAFGLYSMLSRMEPGNIYFRICMARILYREKQYEESIFTCREILARDSIPEILSLTGDGFKNLGKADSALFYYNEVLKRKPGHTATISKKADILLSDRQYSPVIEMTREYLSEDPDNMTILPIYGLALHLNKLYPLSIETFEHQKELGDDSYAVHYYLGLNHYMMNNWTKAVSELETAYQIDSSDVTLVYQLAHAYSHMYSTVSLTKSRLNSKSERLYAKALDMLKPDPGMMHNIYGSMAMARHRVEEYEDAIRYYELSYTYNNVSSTKLSC